VQAVFGKQDMGEQLGACAPTRSCGKCPGSGRRAGLRCSNDGTTIFWARIVYPAPSVCPCCGGGTLRKIGEDVTAARSSPADLLVLVASNIQASYSLECPLLAAFG
jgi:hypothetical protein